MDCLVLLLYPAMSLFYFSLVSQTLEVEPSVRTPLLLCRLCHICSEAAEAHVHLPVCPVCLDPHDSAGGLHPFQFLREQHL